MFFRGEDGWLALGALTLLSACDEFAWLFCLSEEGKAPGVRRCSDAGDACRSASP